MVMKGPAADEIAIHHAGLVHKNPAAHLDVKAAFGHQPPCGGLDATGAGRNFAPVADAGDRLVVLKKPLRHSDQVGIIADILGRPSPAEENAHVLFGLHVRKGHIRLNRVALPLPGDRPTGLYLVQHHLIQPLRRRRHHRHEAVFLQAVIRIQRIDRLSRVADDDQNFSFLDGHGGDDKVLRRRGSRS